MINYIKVVGSKPGWVTLIIGRQIGDEMQSAQVVLPEGGSTYVDEQFIKDHQPTADLGVVASETVMSYDKFGG